MPDKPKTVPLNKAHVQKANPSASARGYDARHQALRRELLAKRPVCEVQGEGCTGWADEAHHKRWPARSIEDYTATCRVCHRKTLHRGA